MPTYEWERVFGSEIEARDRYTIWRHIGSHDIYRRP